MSRSDIEGVLQKQFGGPSPSPSGGVGPPDSATPSASSAPGFVESQLGPLAPLFGYAQRTPVETPGQVLQHAGDVATTAGSQIPGVGPIEQAFGLDPAAAQQRLAGTPYQGAGQALGAASLGAGGEALGIGRGIAKGISPYLGPFLANRLAGAAEQGGLGAAGAASQGEDPTQGGLISGALGALMGPFSKAGVAAKTSAADLRSAADTAEAASKRAYQAAGAVPYNISDVRQAVANARTAIYNAAPRVSIEGQNAMDVLTELDKEAAGAGRGGTISAERLNDYLGKLQMRNTGDAVPDAGQLGQLHINNLLQSGTGAGADALSAANQAFGRFKEADRMADMQRAAETGGPSFGQQAKNYQQGALKKPWMAPGTPGDQGWDLLQSMGKPATTTDLWPSLYDLHHLAYPAIAVGAGYASGRPQDPGAIAEEIGGGLVVGYGLHRGLPFLASPLVRAINAQKIANAQALFQRGVPLPPSNMPPSVSGAGNLLRAIIAARGSQSNRSPQY
jgi:hypothetical protein